MRLTFKERIRFLYLTYAAQRLLMQTISSELNFPRRFSYLRPRERG